LEEFAAKVGRAQSLAGDNPSAHLFNPVNAFQLVNRYSNGWMKLHDKLYEDNAKGELSKLCQYKLHVRSSVCF
jgi:prolyl 4-hydroxylase